MWEQLKDLMLKTFVTAVPTCIWFPLLLLLILKRYVLWADSPSAIPLLTTIFSRKCLTITLEIRNWHKLNIIFRLLFAKIKNGCYKNIMKSIYSVPSLNHHLWGFWGSWWFTHFGGLKRWDMLGSKIKKRRSKQFWYMWVFLLPFFIALAIQKHWLHLLKIKTQNY